MDTFINPKAVKALDLEIVRLSGQLKDTDPTDETYVKISDNLKVLCEARSKFDRAIINPEALLGIAANIIGLLIVLNFERTGVITSKAISFLWKAKI
jgi:hypothetical protein